MTKHPPEKLQCVIYSEENNFDITAMFDTSLLPPQAHGNTNPHFNKALDHLEEAILEAEQIDQEELGISVVSTLEKEQQ